VKVFFDVWRISSTATVFLAMIGIYFSLFCPQIGSIPFISSFFMPPLDIFLSCSEMFELFSSPPTGEPQYAVCFYLLFGCFFIWWALSLSPSAFFVPTILRKTPLLKPVLAHTRGRFGHSQPGLEPLVVFSYLRNTASRHLYLSPLLTKPETC